MEHRDRAQRHSMSCDKLGTITALVACFTRVALPTDENSLTGLPAWGLAPYPKPFQANLPPTLAALFGNLTHSHQGGKP